MGWLNFNGKVFCGIWRLMWSRRGLSEAGREQQKMGGGFFSVTIYIAFAGSVIFNDILPTRHQRTLAGVAGLLLMPFMFAATFWLGWRISRWSASSPMVLVRISAFRKYFRLTLLPFAILVIISLIARFLKR